jgi:hypothetical protein
MKNALAILAVAGVMMLGCTPSDQAPADEAAAPTPAADAGQKITDMDFESGEAEQPAAETEAQEAAAPEPTPDVP